MNASRLNIDRPTLLCVLILLLVPPPGLRAQQPRGAAGAPHITSPYRWIGPSFRVAPYVGYLDAHRGQYPLGPGPAPVFGVRTRVRISSPLSLEANFGYMNSDRYVVDPRLDSGPGVVGQVNEDVLIAEADLQLALTGARTWHGLQPYVLIGAGLVSGLKEGQSSVFASPQESQYRYQLNTAPAVQAGAGVEWFLRRRLSLGIEARDHLWRIKTPSGFFEPAILDRIRQLGVPAPKDTDWTHNLEFSAGLWYYF